jgi:hypothetical protein
VQIRGRRKKGEHALITGKTGTKFRTHLRYLVRRLQRQRASTERAESEGCINKTSISLYFSILLSFACASSKSILAWFPLCNNGGAGGYENVYMRGVERCVRVCLGGGLHKGWGMEENLYKDIYKCVGGIESSFKTAVPRISQCFSTTEIVPALARLLLCFLFPSTRVMPYLCSL